MSRQAKEADAHRAMIEEIRAGLSLEPKVLPSKYFYDEVGSNLFEEICELDAYYPTRTEIGILRRHVGAMAARIGKRAMVIEYGSGAGLKTQLLLGALDEPSACVLIDISRQHLLGAAARLGEEFPAIAIFPIEADYTKEIEIPRLESATPLFFYPGSTIGNFSRDGARDFMASMARMAGPGGGLLIGVDLVKDREILEIAYDDPEGVTAAFNLNLLAHLNRKIGTDFDLGRYRHVAFWNEAESRIEMHLESLGEQVIHLGGASFHVAEGERICTEHSNKYHRQEFIDLAFAAGWRLEKVWTDDREWFGVFYFQVDAVDGR